MTTTNNTPFAEVSQYSRKAGRLDVPKQHEELSHRRRALQETKWELERQIRMVKSWSKEQRRIASQSGLTHGGMMRSDEKIAKEVTARKAPLVVAVRECQIELDTVNDQLKAFERKTSKAECDSKKLMRIESLLRDILKRLPDRDAQ